MNIAVFDGGPGGARGAGCRKIAAAFAGEAGARGDAVTVLELDGLTIKPCLGCFACWVKHPGLCAVKDDAERVLRAMAASDVQVWITPVTFGGYGPALKKALDRLIPNILPFFAMRQGEVHHPPRYERRRSLFAFGTLPGPDGEAERIFRHLVGRNALNLDSVLTESVIVYEGEETGAAGRARELLDAAGGTA